MKRWVLIVGLTALFFTFVAALAGCGVTTDGLQNAADSGDGPGSGMWNPSRPENVRQARQLYNVLERLAEDANEESAKYDRMYVECLDEKGQPLSGDENDDCVKRLVESAGTLDNLFTDFFTGGTVYHSWAQNNEDEDPPNPPDPPDPPKEDPPETEDPEDDDPWGCPPFCCLTCVHSLDVEHVFRPAPVKTEAPSS